MIFETLLLRSEGNLRIEKASKPLPTIAYKSPPKISNLTPKLTSTPHLPRPLKRVKGLLLSLVRDWRERSASNVMDMGTSKQIDLIKELSPLEW